MNLELFRELYNRRSTYPIGISYGHENANDKKYINDEIAFQNSDEFTFLLLTKSFFDSKKTMAIKEELLKRLHLVGVFNVGSILDPYTNVEFSLYIFSDNSPKMVWFGELAEKLKPFKRRHVSVGHRFRNELESLPFEEELYFVKYLESINLAIRDSKKSDYTSEHYRLFGVKASKLESRISISYYRPELIEAEAKLAQEKTRRLGDIAEIIYPRAKIGTESQTYSIKLASAKYPLDDNAQMPIRPGTVGAQLCRGDILTNSFLNSAYLNMTDRRDLFATNTQIIIRAKESQISKEFLTVYLNSERMHSYFSRRSAGAVMPRLSRSDLADFPIVLPTMNEQTDLVSQSYLKTLSKMTDSKERMQDINRVLFSEKPANDKPLQSELLQEMREALLPIKNELVRDLFNSDLSEVEKCYNAGAYKGCLVMCGAILEALVLDWLSEIEGKDYFDPSINTQLKSMINILKDAAKITAQEAQTAHDIRNYRNLIHPQKSIESMPIRGDLCKKVIDNLRPIVRKRYQV